MLAGSRLSTLTEDVIAGAIADPQRDLNKARRHFHNGPAQIQRQKL